MSRVWIVSLLYYPEETSTGHILTRLGEALAAERPVSVLCAQPSYSRRGVRAPRREQHEAVDIRRVRATAFSNTSMLPRLINALTFSISVAFAALLHIRRGDTVLVGTTPPNIAFVVWLVCRLRRTPYVFIVHDLYPDVMIATGVAAPRSLAVRILGPLFARVYRDAARTVVLGRDMAERIAAKTPAAAPRIEVIENWGDEDIEPLPKRDNTLLQSLGLAEKFVLNYAGNMGRPHAIELLADAAEQLRDSPSIHFLFLGSGAKREWLAQRAATLPNVTLLPPRPRSEQNLFLNACDVAMHAFVPGMEGLAVPSRIYNIMAAGRPIIAMAAAGSELARTIAEERIGWLVEPGDLDGFVRAARDAAMSPDLADMGARARRAAVDRYSFAHAAAKYRALLDTVTPAPAHRPR